MDKILSVYWFLVLFIIAGAVVYMAFRFYGSPYNVQGIESRLLADQVENCMINKGFLDDSIFTQQFHDNFLSDCHITFNTEDFSTWKNQPQYYIEVEVYKFDQAASGLIGNSLLNISLGNINIKTAWEISQSGGTVSQLSVLPKQQVITSKGTISSFTNLAPQQERSFYIIDPNGNQYIVKILALVGKNEKNLAQ